MLTSYVLLNPEMFAMETYERRVMGSLILLLGVTLFLIGLQNDQANTVLTIVKRILESSIAGAP
jgi:hypothetical protein